MKTRPRTICSQCSEPGYRFHGDRWLCLIHYRIDTMRNCARGKRKYVPSRQEMEELVADLQNRGMTCGHCGVVMRWHDRKGNLTTVTLQHDRSGRLRLVCMLCNQRHDDLPGDLYFEIPLDHWRCKRCEKVLPLAEFYRDKAGGCCKACHKILNKVRWAANGKRWMENSQRRKQQCG